MYDDMHQPMKPASDAEWDALARYMADESDPSERAIVEEWLATHPEDARLLAAVKARSENFVRQTDIAVNTEVALASVWARLTLATPPVRPRLTLSGSRMGTVRVQPRWRSPMLALAAGLAAVVGSALWRRDGASVARGRMEAATYTTLVGQRDSIRLPDGSEVVLAPGSRLIVAEGSGSAEREVTLDGAAFFKVTHDDARPFVVRTVKAEIRDLGTAFSVNTDASGNVSVAVTHGSVALRERRVGASPSVPVELLAGDRGSLRNGRVGVTRGIVTADDVAWTSGALRYRDAPMTEVQADLRRWYGITLQFADASLSNRTLTASFADDSVAEMLQVIALALGMEMTARGDSVWLGRSASLPATRGPSP